MIQIIERFMVSEMERIKYYRNGYGNKDKSEILSFIENFDYGMTLDLEGIIELYNVLLFLESDGLTNQTEAIENFKKYLPVTFGKFFSIYQLNEDGVSEYNRLEDSYQKDLWAIFVRFGLIKKTIASDFHNFIEIADVPAVYLLHYEGIVKKYSFVLKNFLLKKPKSFEIFVNFYDISTEPDFYFPTIFNENEVIEWASRYCELPDANTNYLESIMNWSNKQIYKFDPKVKLLAERARKRILGKIFNKNSGQPIEMTVGFQDDLDRDFDFKKGDALNFTLLFNKKILLDDMEPPSILNNFIYVFGFYDLFQGFSYARGGYDSAGLLDALTQQKSKYNYTKGYIQKITDDLYDLVFYAYFDFLNYHGVDLEEVFANFYNTQIESNYHKKGFFFSPSSSQVSFYERCKVLLPEMDSILKQYELFYNEGEIDEDLFEIGSLGGSYQSLRSFKERKFCYFESDRIIELSKLLFSNQSILATYKGNNELKTFHLRVLEGITREEFNEYQIEYVDRLITEQVLGSNVANQLYFKEENLIVSLYLLWSVGYINLQYCPNEILESVQRMHDSGDVRYGSTLFSEQEIDMISFYMDDKKFGNSLAIRNKITHGRMARKNLDEIKSHYLRLLMILLLYTIRIAEELDMLDNPSESVAKED
jgi:hypothetical protein